MTKQSGQSKGRLTNAERAARMRAEQAERVANFGANRAAIWQRLLHMATTLVLAKTIHEQFAQEQEYGLLPKLSVDLLKQSISIVGIASVTLETLTLDIAERFEQELQFLQSELEAFQCMALRYEREQAVLVELRRAALQKLSEAERMALGLLKADPAGYQFKHPRKLEKAERDVLESAMAVSA